MTGRLTCNQRCQKTARHHRMDKSSIGSESLGKKIQEARAQNLAIIL